RLPSAPAGRLAVVTVAARATHQQPRQQVTLGPRLPTLPLLLAVLGQLLRHRREQVPTHQRPHGDGAGPPPRLADRPPPPRRPPRRRDAAPPPHRRRGGGDAPPRRRVARPRPPRPLRLPPRRPQPRPPLPQLRLAVAGLPLVRRVAQHPGHRLGRPTPLPRRR